MRHPYCVAPHGGPCRASPTCRPAELHEPDMSNNGFPRSPRRPRIALVSFSDRPQLRAATWPSLRRFAEAYPGRYFLELHTEAMLDPRDFHAAWNKIAYMRR